MRQRRPDPRRRAAPRGDAAWWVWADGALRRRSGGRCECCGGPPSIVGGLERHHRIRRRDGGDRLSNLLMLAADCHHYWTEHPAEARARGIIVSALGGADPTDVPVHWRGRTWVVLDDEGATSVRTGDPPP